MMMNIEKINPEIDGEFPYIPIEHENENEAVNFYFGLMFAARDGDIESAKSFLPRNPDRFISIRYLLEALNYGKLEFADWLCQIEPGLKFYIFCVQDDLKSAMNFLENYPDFKPSFDNCNVFIGACKHGRIQVAKWLLQLLSESGVEINKRSTLGFALVSACAYGHVEIVEWILSLKSEMNISDIRYAIEMAFYNHNIQMVKLIYKNFPKLDTSILDNFFKKFNLDLKLLICDFIGSSIIPFEPIEPKFVV
jgi:ankyrin repeat protein